MWEFTLNICTVHERKKRQEKNCRLYEKLLGKIYIGIIPTNCKHICAYFALPNNKRARVRVIMSDDFIRFGVLLNHLNLLTFSTHWKFKKCYSIIFLAPFTKANNCSCTIISLNSNRFLFPFFVFSSPIFELLNTQCNSSNVHGLWYWVWNRIC